MKENRFSGKFGEEYDLIKLAFPYADELQRQVGKAIRDHFRYSQGDRLYVFEIGTGTGATTSEILHSDQRIIVSSVDNERTMIKQAQKNLDEYVQRGRAQLVVSDALNLLRCIPDSTHHCFASAWTMHNFDREYRGAVLEEIHRILTKGALFVNVDKYPFDDEEKQEAERAFQWARYDVYEECGKPELKGQWLEHEAEDMSEAKIMKELESVEEMRKIGFVNIEVVWRKHMDACIIAKK